MFDKPILFPKEVQKLFNISAPTEISWERDGKLPKATYMGKRKYYISKEIESIITRDSLHG